MKIFGNVKRNFGIYIHNEADMPHICGNRKDIEVVIKKRLLL